MSDTASGLLVLPPTTQPACVGRQQPASASLPTIPSRKMSSSSTSTKPNTTASTAATTTIKPTSTTTTTTNSNTSSPRASPPPRRTQKFPTPLIFPPLGGKHKQTFIVLHNRGTNARRFGPRFVEQPVSPLCAASPASSSASSLSGSDKATSPVSEPPSPSYNISNLQTLLPYTRFVFPSAAMGRSSAHDGSTISQWFDMDPSATAADNERLMVDGLRETTAYLHGLIEREAKLVVGGAKNVILGGLSQGSAASLVAMLLWDGEPLRACVGMAGWLPLSGRLQRVTATTRDSRDKDDVLIRRLSLNDTQTETDGDEKGTAHVVEELAGSSQAVTFLRRHLGLSTTDDSIAPAAFARTPVFIGHGSNDDLVSVDAASQTASCLSALGFDVHHEEYDGLGNWYSEQMLGDVVGFLGSIDTPIMLQATACPAHDEPHSDSSSAAFDESKAA